MAGIKETLELLDGVKALAVIAKKVMADGKVNMADIPILIGAVNDFSVLATAVQGADQIIAEAKDLSVDEAQLVLAKLFEVVAAVKA